jgi:8-oxo-dGTP pyrophosphatase MutT (NUDIX family)
MSVERVNVAKVLVRRRTDGKYLLLRGSLWSERPDRSQQPDLPGGTVEVGESMIEGCLRELMEEAGITASSGDLQLVHAASYIHAHSKAAINRLIYFLELEQDPTITLSWEHEGYEWLPAAEVLALDMREPYPELFRYLQKTEILV